MGNRFYKTVIINRAVPGSGKTSITKIIKKALESEDLSVEIHSTDEFFMENGRYCFDVTKLAYFHQCNLDNFANALERGVDVVFCDNTNIEPWESVPYTDMAREFGYKILFINLTPRELYKHVLAQQVTPEKPDAHGVPEEQLVVFIDGFNTYNSLLDKSAEVDHNKHFCKIWNQENLCTVEEESSDVFDFDDVITIEPFEYHEAKLTIGAKVVDLLKKN